jgi:hypothetical protein
MACRNTCRLCKKLTLSTAIAVSGSNLVITIPSGCYLDDTKYCIVTAQSIPSTATINMPVYVQIGSTGTVLYPLINCDGTQIVAADIQKRTRYATRVETSPTSGVFRLLGNICCDRNNNLASITGTTPTTTAVASAVAETDIAVESEVAETTITKSGKGR